MNDEIKEILQMLEAMASNDDIAFLPRQASLLLDYITNLQTIEQQYSAILSENAELENKINNLQEENERLRVKKWQIKELKKEWSDINENSTLVFENNNLIEFMNKLENILKGDNND